ncbi:MAG: peptidoglycan bridge formation glycyltransferase FemA/FemB family protein [Candidatus Magasanikbacteria bacterium]
MYVKEIEHKGEWKEFVLHQSNTLFVQSPSYGDFYNQMKEGSWIFGLYNENNELIAGFLVLSTHARRGNFLYVPYGPVFDDSLMHGKKDFESAFSTLVDFLKRFAKDNKYHFIRMSPFLEDTAETRGAFLKAGFRDAPIHTLAEVTWILDLEKDQDSLLSAMNKNHRNLIRRCSREGVRVEMHTDDEALARLNGMHTVVAKRHNFQRFSAKYISDEFHAFVQEGEVVIFEAYLPDGRLDSSAIVMFFGSMANYRHSASLGLDKRLPTSYAVQWEVIKESMKRPMSKYNLWGIAPSGAPKDHPFHGITHFKKGFGGNQKNLVPCQDLPLSKFYWLTWGIETLRRIKRGF